MRKSSHLALVRLRQNNGCTGLEEIRLSRLNLRLAVDAEHQANKTEAAEQRQPASIFRLGIESFPFLLSLLQPSLRIVLIFYSGCETEEVHLIKHVVQQLG